MIETNRRVALVALHAGYSHSSLALRSMAAYARRWGCEHEMALFESLVNTSHQVLLESLVEFDPALIGFSTYLWNIEASLHLARVLKQLLPECRILLGGPEAGPRGEALLHHSTEVDFVIAGEGEAALTELMDRLFGDETDWSGVSGLHYRCDNRVVRNSIRALPVEKIPTLAEQGDGGETKSLVYWETSRGCPYRCSFCSSATESLRAFPMQRVLSDLELLCTLRNKTVKLLDRSFHLGKQRTSELLRRFADTPQGLRFHLELNPDRISDEAMAIFRDCEPGKFQFEIGLQSLDDQVLRRIDRCMDVDKALANIRILVEQRRHPVHLDLIVGLPGESGELCARSLDRTFLLYPDHLQLGTLKLLPGTPLEQQAASLGYRWDPQPPYEILAHPELDFIELVRFKRYAELLERLYNSGYMRNTLAGLVTRVFNDSLCACFDALLVEAGLGLVRDNLQPDSLFERMSGFLQPFLKDHSVLGEWLLWDYAQFSLVNGKTPDWIAHHLRETGGYVVQGSRRRLPILNLSDQAVAMINRQSGRNLQQGRYAIWPRQHKKGVPVEILSVDEGSVPASDLPVADSAH
jgi:anaerobic magnesium-protoporphyrin IX monomethyl ester cyclase